MAVPSLYQCYRCKKHVPRTQTVGMYCGRCNLEIKKEKETERKEAAKKLEDEQKERERERKDAQKEADRKKEAREKERERERKDAQKEVDRKKEAREKERERERKVAIKEKEKEQKEAEKESKERAKEREIERKEAKRIALKKRDELERQKKIDSLEKEKVRKKILSGFCSVQGRKKNAVLLFNTAIMDSNEHIMNAIAIANAEGISLGVNHFTDSLNEHCNAWNAIRAKFHNDSSDTEVLFDKDGYEVSGVFSDEVFDGYVVDAIVPISGIPNGNILWEDATKVHYFKLNKTEYYAQREDDGIRIPTVMNFAISGKNTKYLKGKICAIRDEYKSFLEKFESGIEEAKSMIKVEIEENIKRIEEEKRIEAKRVEDEKRIENERRIEEERRIELKRIEEEKRIKNEKRIEDERRIEEAKRINETKRIEEAKRIEELKRIEEARYIEESKSIADANMHWEAGDILDQNHLEVILELCLKNELAFRGKKPNEFLFGSSIDNKKRQNVIEKCNLSVDPLLIIDLTLFGSAKNAIAFTGKGIHWNTDDGFGYVSYNKLTKISFDDFSPRFGLTMIEGKRISLSRSGCENQIVHYLRRIKSHVLNVKAALEKATAKIRPIQEIITVNFFSDIAKEILISESHYNNILPNQFKIGSAISQVQADIFKDKFETRKPLIAIIVAETDDSKIENETYFGFFFTDDGFYRRLPDETKYVGFFCKYSDITFDSFEYESRRYKLVGDDYCGLWYYSGNFQKISESLFRHLRDKLIEVGRI